jgi:membrane protease YdiL (CAAX protease family)
VELGIVLVLSFWSLPIRVWQRAGATGIPMLREPLVVQVSTAAFHIAFAALLLFLIWRRAGSLEPAGLAHLQWSWELLFGVVILGATLCVYFLTRTLASMAGLQSWRSDAPSPVGPGVFYPLMLLAAAFHEEVLFRGYLIGRFETLAGRAATAAPAVLLSSLLFAIGHVASPARSLELVGAGLLWGGIFASARRLPRLVFAHWAWNLVVLYWLPLSARP